MPGVNGAAAKSGLRLYQSAVPCSSLVPDCVVALITPPPVVPYSAENAEVCTVNSCTVSGEKLTMVRRQRDAGVVGAVRHDHGAHRTAAAERQIAARARRSARDHRIFAARIAGHVGQGQSQVEYAAVQQWRIFNLALCYGAAQRAGRGVDHHRRCLHRHLRIHRPCFQFDTHGGDRMPYRL